MNAHPAAEVFPLLEGAALEELAADIRANGLRHPIIALNGLVLDGRNRLAACRLADVSPRFVEWDGEGDPLTWVLSTNLHRRHLNESQRGMVGARCVAYHEAQAKERKGGRPRRGDEKPVENLPPVSAGKSRDAAGAAVNVSGKTVDAAKKVLASAAAEVVRAVESGRVAVSAAADLADRPKDVQREIVRKVEAGEARSVREALRQNKREELAKRGSPLPSGPKRYRVLYADPPWEYGDTRAGLEGYAATAAEDHYPTMSVEDLSALDVKALAEDDAVLFCWATFPLIPDALVVVKAWGFTYKTAFVWSKMRANFGHYHKADAELLLVCTRGSCTPESDKRESQVQDVARGKHSAKPEAFREMVDRMYPSGARLELFRRGKAPAGWDVFGNEAIDAA